MNREERRAKYGKYFSSAYRTDVDYASPTRSLEDDFVLDTGATLKKNDLKQNYQYLNPIREYMIERKGVDYKDMDADEVVEDFVDHMRYFNANSVSTAGEVRFINKADDNQKKKAEKAYRIYDQLGNVFVNDGNMGAVDGVKDYIYAAATDPTNYLGLATGGIGRFFTGGGKILGKKVIRDSVRRAGREALKNGGNKEAAIEAARKAGAEAAKRAVTEGADAKTANRLYDDVAKRVSLEGRRALAKDAMKAKQAELFDTTARKALYTTTALDGAAALLQDVQAQEVYMEAGAQESYNKLSLVLSPLLGGVAGAAQLGFGKFRGASGFEDTGDSLERVANVVIEETTPVFKTVAEQKEVAETIKKSVEGWNAKVERGQAGTPAELIHDIMLGADKQGGVAKLYADKGFKITREKHISDVMTNVMRFLPDEEVAEINKAMIKYTGISVGELTTDRTKIGDFVAKQINEAGKTLNVMSQVRKTIDGTIVAAHNKMADTVAKVEAREAGKTFDEVDPITNEITKAKKSQPLKYGQSVWKRLLVSSPATTAVNVAGFSQFYMGQTLADILNGTNYAVLGLGQLGLGQRKLAAESFRKMRALGAIQAQKFRNLLDPYTTHDAYMAFLKENNDVKKTLFETISGGVDATAGRFNMNPESKLFRGIEAFANGSGQISGVKIQDSFTKSQMFMTELDKYLRIEKDITLKEALLSDTNVIDEVSLQGALDGTLKSVFAKDYTTDETPELLRTMARLAEGVSNTPVFGTVLPFGRFFNNVIATTYQWSPFAAPEIFAEFVKRTYKGQSATFSEGEAFGRMMVGTSAIMMAIDYDKERRSKGLGVYEMEVGGGTIIDAKNTFPFSTFLIAGRIGNMKLNGEKIPRELIQEAGTQIGIGQLARDVQFGNDVNNLLDIFLNSDGASRGATLDGLYKVAGNFAAGFTRPVDAFNKIAGFAMGTDGARDVRQADGANVFIQSSTKYVDNLIEALSDKADNVTGEELRVATREGQVYDPNPFARIFGITVKPGRTATEKAYSVANMFPWQANERTNIPAYDKALNALLAPTLEKKTQALLNSNAFQKASLTGKRDMLKTILSDTKASLRKDMGAGWYGQEREQLRLAAKASQKGTKEIREEAMQIMKDRYGVSGKLEDFSFRELDLFMEYVDYLEDIYDEVANI